MVPTSILRPAYKKVRFAEDDENERVEFFKDQPTSFLRGLRNHPPSQIQSTPIHYQNVDPQQPPILDPVHQGLNQDSVNFDPQASSNLAQMYQIWLQELSKITQEPPIYDKEVDEGEFYESESSEEEEEEEPVKKKKKKPSKKEERYKPKYQQEEQEEEEDEAMEEEEDSKADDLQGWEDSFRESAIHACEMALVAREHDLPFHQLAIVNQERREYKKDRRDLGASSFLSSSSSSSYTISSSSHNKDCVVPISLKSCSFLPHAIDNILSPSLTKGDANRSKLKIKSQTVDKRYFKYSHSDLVARLNDEIRLQDEVISSMVEINLVEEDLLQPKNGGRSKMRVSKGGMGGTEMKNMALHQIQYTDFFNKIITPEDQFRRLEDERVEGEERGRMELEDEVLRAQRIREEEAVKQEELFISLDPPPSLDTFRFSLDSNSDIWDVVINLRGEARRKWMGNNYFSKFVKSTFSSQSYIASKTFLEDSETHFNNLHLQLSGVKGIEKYEFLSIDNLIESSIFCDEGMIHKKSTWKDLIPISTLDPTSMKLSNLQTDTLNLQNYVRYLRRGVLGMVGDMTLKNLYFLIHELFSSILSLMMNCLKIPIERSMSKDEEKEDERKFLIDEDDFMEGNEEEEDGNKVSEIVEDIDMLLHLYQHYYSYSEILVSTNSLFIVYKLYQLVTCLAKESEEEHQLNGERESKEEDREKLDVDSVEMRVCIASLFYHLLDICTKELNFVLRST